MIEQRLLIDLTPFNVYLTTYPLYPPPFVRERERKLEERLRLSLTLLSQVKLELHLPEEIAFPFLKERAGNKTKNQAAEMSLPRYIWQKGEDEETTNYG